MILGLISHVFLPTKEITHSSHLKRASFVHVCHRKSWCSNVGLQSGAFFPFYVAFSPFTSHIVTKLKLLAKLAHTLVEKTHLRGKTSKVKQPAVRSFVDYMLAQLVTLHFGD